MTNSRSDLQLSKCLIPSLVNPLTPVRLIYLITLLRFLAMHSSVLSVMLEHFLRLRCERFLDLVMTLSKPESVIESENERTSSFKLLVQSEITLRQLSEVNLQPIMLSFSK